MRILHQSRVLINIKSMPENYYDSESDDESSPSQAESDESSDTSKRDKDDDDGNTALLPKSIFGGHKCKVGDIKKFKIVALYDDEAEVKYIRSDKKDDDKDDESDSKESDQMKDSMDSMEAAYS